MYLGINQAKDDATASDGKELGWVECSHPLIRQRHIDRYGKVVKWHWTCGFWSWWGRRAARALLFTLHTSLCIPLLTPSLIPNFVCHSNAVGKAHIADPRTRNL